MRLSGFLMKLLTGLHVVGMVRHRHAKHNQTPPLGAERRGGAVIGRVRPTHYVLCYGSSVAAPHRSIEPILEAPLTCLRLRLLARRTQANAKAEDAEAVRREGP